MSMDVSAIPGPQMPDSGTKKQSGAMPLAEFDEFLNLFVSQLRYQDPLSPMDGEQFLAQTAQFSTVEQLVHLNGVVEDVTATAAMGGQASAAALIGRAVAGTAVDPDGVEQAVSGRVVSVAYSRGGDLLLGLDGGQTLPLSAVHTISET